MIIGDTAVLVTLCPKPHPRDTVDFFFYVTVLDHVIMPPKKCFMILTF